MKGGAERRMEGVRGASFSTDGQRILTWSVEWPPRQTGKVRSWRATNGQSLGLPTRLEGRVLDIGYSPQGERRLTCISDDFEGGLSSLRTMDPA